ncbi:hypothetical protein CMUS01_10647 [Colletotrichum musicola]|uniref:Uncharacterized protein n=1 Tax=Colletotrichum musicola TaxID=2175873 RepID=A0A8H6K1U9_9PEZI|nr:hypothetical protein CMUS01_10647 [Colletotrichum musicola]
MDHNPPSHFTSGGPIRTQHSLLPFADSAIPEHATSLAIRESVELRREIVVTLIQGGSEPGPCSPRVPYSVQAAEKKTVRGTHFAVNPEMHKRTTLDSPSNHADGYLCGIVSSPQQKESIESSVSASASRSSGKGMNSPYAREIQAQRNGLRATNPAADCSIPFHDCLPPCNATQTTTHNHDAFSMDLGAPTKLLPSIANPQEHTGHKPNPPKYRNPVDIACCLTCPVSLQVPAGTVRPWPNLDLGSAQIKLSRSRQPGGVSILHYGYTIGITRDGMNATQGTIVGFAVAQHQKIETAQPVFPVHRPGRPIRYPRSMSRPSRANTRRTHLDTPLVALESDAEAPANARLPLRHGVFWRALGTSGSPAHVLPSAPSVSSPPPLLPIPLPSPTAND